jgi:hypothetical protein
MDAGLEVPTRYFISGNVAFIKTDKGFLELEIVSPSTLKGRDEWTEGSTYVLEGRPEKACLPYELSTSEEAEIAGLVCMMSGIKAKMAGDIEGAAEK